MERRLLVHDRFWETDLSPDHLLVILHLSTQFEEAISACISEEGIPMRACVSDDGIPVMDFVANSGIRTSDGTV
jgi:hypothetical protein